MLIGIILGVVLSVSIYADGNVSEVWNGLEYGMTLEQVNQILDVDDMEAVELDSDVIGRYMYTATIGQFSDVFVALDFYQDALFRIHFKTTLDFVNCVSSYEAVFDIFAGKYEIEPEILVYTPNPYDSGDWINSISVRSILSIGGYRLGLWNITNENVLLLKLSYLSSRYALLSWTYANTVIENEVMEAIQEDRQGEF